jgi:hypothetical protein
MFASSNNAELRGLATGEIVTGGHDDYPAYRGRQIPRSLQATLAAGQAPSCGTRPERIAPVHSLHAPYDTTTVLVLSSIVYFCSSSLLNAVAGGWVLRRTKTLILAVSRPMTTVPRAGESGVAGARTGVETRRASVRPAA